jgi:hypothetical protein
MEKRAALGRRGAGRGGAHLEERLRLGSGMGRHALASQIWRLSCMIGIIIADKLFPHGFVSLLRR